MSFLIPARPWSDIEKFYSELPDRPANATMLDIVRYLRQPPFEETLYGSTSMFTLLIAQTKKISFDTQVLRIESSDDEVRFTYNHHEPQPDSLRPWNQFKPWKTTASPAGAVSKLERILLKRLRWYRRTAV